MEYIISGYQPESMFRYFEQISAIPRCSGKEEKIADFLVEWAKEHGIFCTRDACNNVYMTVEATEGYEDCDAVLLQGHTDMVCEKRPEVVHDFDTDPLKLMLKNGILKAEGTTLGGDDGIAVAMMMALMTESIPHPRLECLFTADEENGMGGVQGFDYSPITATRLINLDSEEEGVATVSCAGGARVCLRIPIKRHAIPKTDGILRVGVGRLSGGHSGADIHLGKYNANEVLAGALMKVYEKAPFHLISIRGGTKDNAITRDSEAILYTSEPALTRQILAFSEIEMREEAIKEDKGLKITVRKCPDGTASGMLSLADTSVVLDTILLAPTGPITFCPSERTLTESSANLGIVESKENEVFLSFLARSSSESRMDALLCLYSRLAKRLGAEISVHDRYPGWQYAPESPLRDQFLRVAGEIFGDRIKPRASAIHAGLECGYILSSVKHRLDAISIGPNLKHIHSPDEALSLPSCETLWKIVTAMLAEKANQN